MTCVQWTADPVMGHIGPVTIYWYGLLFSIAFLIGYFLLYWQFRRGQKISNLDDLVLFSRLIIYLIVGVALGAYLGERIFYRWRSFWADPLLVLSPGQGLRGLSSHGGFLGAMAAAYLFHLQTKVQFLEILDSLTFSGASGIVLVRLGNLMNSECLGRSTAVPWAIAFPRHDTGLTPRHPVQIYEAGVGLMLLLVLMMVDRKYANEKRPLGLLTGIFFSGYFSLRAFVEFFKEGELIYPYLPITVGQVLSLPLMLMGIWLIIRVKNTS